jgi:hypothetical protein
VFTAPFSPFFFVVEDFTIKKVKVKQTSVRAGSYKGTSTTIPACDLGEEVCREADALPLPTSFEPFGLFSKAQDLAHARRALYH